MTFRKLPDLVEPKLPEGHEKSELLDFVKRAFTWDERKDESEVLEVIEAKVREFSNEHFKEAENIIEIFNITESMDVSREDRLLLELQTEIARIDEEVTRRYLRAQYSYYLYDDKYWDAYRKPVSGTTNDLTAFARKESREDRFFYFVQYSDWKQINDKLFGIKQIVKQIQSRQYHR